MYDLSVWAWFEFQDAAIRVSPEFPEYRVRVIASGEQDTGKRVASIVFSLPSAMGHI